MPPRRSRKSREKKKKREEAKAKAEAEAKAKAAQPTAPCVVCGTATTIQCPCNTVFLCGRACQVKNWKTHKAECPARASRRKGRKKKEEGEGV